MPDEKDRQNQLTKSDNGKSGDNQKTTSATNRTKKKYRISAYQFRVATLVFDGLLVLVGAVYSFFSYQQWQVSADAAKAAKDSVTFAQTNRRLDQRPWVAVVSMNGHPTVPEVSNPVIVKIRFRNTGKTPAMHTIVHTVMVVRETSQGDFDFESDERSDAQEGINGVHSEALIAPGSLYELTAPISAEVFSTDNVDKIKSDLIRVFIFGRITYVDIFGCHHWTTFCHKMSPTGEYNAYKTYNETDNSECP